MIFGTRPEAIKIAPLYIKMKEKAIGLKVIEAGTAKLIGTEEETVYQAI